MAHQKLNIGIGIALGVAIVSVVVLMFVPSGSVEAPTAPTDGVETTSDTVDDSATEEIPSAQYNDLIRVSEPLPESTITSPLTIRGEARGQWFFEGDFPVILTNWDGLIIAEGVATAEGEWMTEEYVPFMATLTFTPDTMVSNRANLILQKSNASGLSEHDDAFEYTVYFAE